jgi:DNA repair exonuclease SbcCD ATPase subunit
VTATVARPDLVDVLKRADGQYAKRAGDDPAIPEYLTALATAVRPLLGQPAAGPVDDVQVKQLLDDKQRLGDLAGELRKQAESRAKVIDGQTREIADLKRQLDAADEDTRRRIDAAVGALETPLRTAQDDADKLRQALTLRTQELDEARAERDTARAQLRDKPGPDLAAVGQLQTENSELADQLAQAQGQLSLANRSLELANRTLDEIADEEPAAAHVHHYPVDGPGEEAQPCVCGQPYPRSYAHAEFEDIVPDVEPWGDLFGRIRDQVGEAGWTK